MSAPSGPSSDRMSSANNDNDRTSDAEPASKKSNSSDNKNSSVAQSPASVVTNHSAQSNDQPEPSERECRICRERERENEELISPCNCRGSIAFIHKQCLKRCIEITRKIRCSICRGSYRHVDIQIRFQGLLHYALANPLLVLFYAFSISSLLGNQLLLMHRTLQFQHRQYLHFQKRLLLLRQLTAAYELPSLHFKPSTTWTSLQEPDFSRKMPFVQPLWSPDKSQPQCSVQDQCGPLNITSSEANSIQRTKSKQFLNDKGKEEQDFNLIELKSASIWIRWKRRIFSFMFRPPKTSPPPKSFDSRLNGPIPVTDQKMKELKRQIRDNLLKQQANLFLRYLAAMVFHLANDFMHIFSISLFLWYLWDNFSVNFTVWKARNALFKVII